MDMPKKPSNNKGCLVAFIICLLLFSILMVAGTILNINDTKKDLSFQTAQYSDFAASSSEGEPISVEDASIVSKKTDQVSEDVLEGKSMGEVELLTKIEELKKDLKTYYLMLVFFILQFLFCVGWLIKRSSSGTTTSSALLSEPSKSKIQKLRSQISTTDNPQKRLVLSNYLGHVIKDDAEKRLKPLVEKYKKRVGRNPIPKNEEQLKIYEDQYNSAITEAKELIVDIDSSLCELERNNYKEFCDAFQAFKSCNKTWAIISSQRNTELKSSAYTTVEKTPAVFKTGAFPSLVIPYKVPIFPSGDRGHCYYYPRFVIYGDSIDNFEVYPLDSVSFRYKATRFIEDGVRPTDAQQVDTTYKYVNKNGGPDRRYSYNPVMPVLLYGDIIISPFGDTFQVSNSDAAMKLELAFRVLKEGYSSTYGNHIDSIPDTPVSEGPVLDGRGSTSKNGTISEPYFNDLLDAAKRLWEFGDKLSKDLDFCKTVGESITGTINWNGRILTKPEEKMPVLLWADVIHCYIGLGHDLILSTNEGLGILMFNTLMIDPNFQLEYRFLDLIREKLTASSEAFTRNAVSSMSGNEDVFMLEVCLREHKKQLHNQYVVLLYRFASLIAKADKSVSSTEASWLNRIMSLKEPEGIDDVMTPTEPIDGPKDKKSTKKPRTNALKELNSLIGLTSVKSEISTLINYIKVQQMREEKGMKTSPVSYHCVFTGSPGTGKTTVARIVSEIYKELGILKKGHLIETDRSGLVAEYVGQTAVKTNKIIDSALDGVLFIDEAYSLVDGGNSDYGKEAISTLIKRMEDDRDRLVVILAGYTDDMKRFIDSNPGLQSRFNRYIEFPDYTAEEMYQIFLSNAQKYEYTVSDDAQSVLRKAMEKAVEEKNRSFGNGRFVRNLFEKVIENQANRLSLEADVTSEILASIEEEDIRKSL